MFSRYRFSSSQYGQDTILKYSEAIHELVVVIGTQLAESLGVSTENMGIEKWPCKFRINKYHFTPESVGSADVQIHSDSGFLTILQDDEGVGGLEVIDKSGEFVWSNGRFHNVKHRVQCKEAKIRVTIASFLLGPRGMVEAPAELVDDEHPRLYVPTTYEDYRKTMLSMSLQAGEALALLYTPK
ncbi:putative flavanone 3-dioxygenase [Helianthus anomalus]